MTVDEVKHLMEARAKDEEGALIECRDVYQRAEAVQFLLSIGYELEPNTKKWLEDNPTSTAFLHPGLSDSLRIVCWRFSIGRAIICFDDVEALIAQNDTPIDERSNEEFSEAFMALMS